MSVRETEEMYGQKSMRTSGFIVIRYINVRSKVYAYALSQTERRKEKNMSRSRGEKRRKKKEMQEIRMGKAFMGGEKNGCDAEWCRDTEGLHECLKPKKKLKKVWAS
jgi:hypothetical protein